MDSVIAAASTLAFAVALAMLAVGTSAFVVRFAVRSVSGPTVMIYWRITNGLFIAYFFFTGQFFWLVFWVAGINLPKTRQGAERNALIVQASGLVLFGTMAVLDKMGIDYWRATVLIPAAFLFLIAFVWAGIVESKKEYTPQPAQTSSEANHS